MIVYLRHFLIGLWSVSAQIRQHIFHGALFLGFYLFLAWGAYRSLHLANAVEALTVGALLFLATGLLAGLILGIRRVAASAAAYGDARTGISNIVSLRSRMNDE